MIKEVEEEKALGYDFYKMKVASEFGTKQDWDLVREKKLLKSIDVYYPE